MNTNLISYLEEHYYEDCRELFLYYGEELSLEWLKEEAAEYIQACCRKKERFSIDDVYSEIADVIIITYQLYRFGSKEAKDKAEIISKEAGKFIGFFERTPKLKNKRIIFHIIDKMERSIDRIRGEN